MIMPAPSYATKKWHLRGAVEKSTLTLFKKEKKYLQLKSKKHEHQKELHISCYPFDPHHPPQGP